MRWFEDEQFHELKKQLRASQQDFRFDKQSIKFHLLQKITRTDQQLVRPSKINISIYAVSMASVVLLVTLGLTATVNANPGETLFNITKWREKAILSLPLPEEKKIEIETNIVNKRLEALDMVEQEVVTSLPQPETQKQTKQKEIRVLETVKESEQSLNAALDQIITNQSEIKAEKIDEALTKLDEISKDREGKIQKLEERENNAEVKAKIKTHREEFKKARQKVQAQIEERRMRKEQLRKQEIEQTKNESRGNEEQDPTETRQKLRSQERD